MVIKTDLLTFSFVTLYQEKGHHQYDDISTFSSCSEFLQQASFGSFLVLRQEIGELALQFDHCRF